MQSLSPAPPSPTPAEAATRRVLILPGHDLRELLALDAVVPAVEAAYVAHARGEARLFPVVREPLGAAGGVFGVKSGFWPARDALGLKAAGYWSDNRVHGLDNHQATVLLVDPASGVARAFMDGNWITFMRTAAAGAIGARWLARPDVRRALVVGTGVQAEGQVRALHWWGGGRLEILVVEPLDDRDGRRAAAFAERLCSDGVACRPAADLEGAVRAADVVVTVTPSTTPIVARDWLKPGTHVTALGADTRGKQEHDVATLRAARVVVDDWQQASELGECQHAVAAGALGETPALIGDVIAGAVEGRRSADEITLFDATGIALQDLAVAELAERLATEAGLGTRLELD